MQIAEDTSYREHLNRYDVIYLDMAMIKSYSEGYRNVVQYVTGSIARELREAYPSLGACEELSALMIRATELTGNKFIMIIDEWDAPIREVPETQKEYLQFLRMLFKSSGTTARIFAGVYMTGILPVKKDGSQSALSDFEEYTMLNPYRFGSYVGFTEREVKALCLEYQVDFEMMKQWYDGYHFADVGSVYNPNSVMKAIRNRNFDSYWTATSASESLMEYISMDYEGLGRMVAELLGGSEVPVNPIGFANDLVTFRNRDHVLTLLIHLGYLAYDAKEKTAYIPNEEIRLEFANAVREVKNADTIQRVKESDRLIQDTIHLNAEAVAAQIEKIHREETAPLFYNREEDLRSVIKLAYFAYKDHYLKFEELPSGDGYADIVYLPKRRSPYPALVVELKWNEDAHGAIDQIREKHYPEVLEGFGGEILLVGVSYDRSKGDEKHRHKCVIERV